MLVALIIVGVLLVISLAANIFGWGRGGATASPELQQKLAAETAARQKIESDLEKKRKDVEEVRRELGEVRDQLRQTKKKLHDQREEDKGARDLQKAREEQERAASAQLESTRAELAAALAEVSRLRAESEPGARRRPAPVAAPEPVAAAPAPTPAPERPAPQRVIRELSEAEKQKMERLEQQASKDRAKAIEAEKELRRVKGRAETQHRVYTVTKGELDLVKDKFKALEKRLNRILLENDLLRRALVALEKKSGVAAERTELTADEIAGSDRQTEERAAAEAAAEERRAEEARKAAEEELARAKGPEAETTSPTDAASASAVATTEDATPANEAVRGS